MVAIHSTTFSVVYKGDAHYLPKTIVRAVTVRARVSMTNNGYFASTRIGGVRYRVYHHTALLGAFVTVAPDKHGQCVELEVQQRVSGGWIANQVFGCFALNSSSKVTAYLGLLRAGTARYRVRADYERSSKDPSNLSTDSSWFYFEVVR